MLAELCLLDRERRVLWWELWTRGAEKHLVSWFC